MDIDLKYMYEIMFFLELIDVIFCILFFILTLISWIRIPKWRNFKNYIYVNLGISRFIYYVLVFGSVLFGIVYCSFVFYLWVLILSIKVYTDLVEIFQINITRIFLKSSIFAWGIPLFIEFGYNIIASYHEVYIANVGIETAILILLLINFTLYIKVVYSLSKFNPLNDRASRCRKIEIATLSFFICGMPWMISFSLDYPTIFIEYNENVTLKINTISSVVFSAQNIIFKLCFCLLKSNRELWSEFFERKRRTRRIDVEVGMIAKSKSKQVLSQNELEVTYL